MDNNDHEEISVNNFDDDDDDDEPPSKRAKKINSKNIVNDSSAYNERFGVCR